MNFAFFLYTLTTLGVLGTLFYLIQVKLIAGLLGSFSSELKKLGGKKAILLWSILTSLAMLFAWVFPNLAIISFLVQILTFAIIFKKALNQAGIVIK